MSDKRKWVPEIMYEDDENGLSSKKVIFPFVHSAIREFVVPRSIPTENCFF